MTKAYIAIPLSPMRKVIAARMVEATRTVPHFRLVAEIELDALLAMRRQLGQEVTQGRLELHCRSVIC